jgi:hypothetical protein
MSKWKTLLIGRAANTVLAVGLIEIKLNQQK